MCPCQIVRKMVGKSKQVSKRGAAHPPPPTSAPARNTQKNANWIDMKILSLDFRQGRSLPDFDYTSGIYGLVDPLDARIRYVGSSIYIERRLYRHHHFGPRKTTRPCMLWMREMVGAGWTIDARLLEAVAPKDLDDLYLRNDLERGWVERLHELGEADLNQRLAPKGHPHAGHSPYRQIRSHVTYLERLLRENDIAFQPLVDKKGR